MSARTVKRAIHVAVPEKEHEPVVSQPIQPVAQQVVEDEVTVAPVENEVVVEPVVEPVTVSNPPVVASGVVGPEYESKSSHSFKWIIVLVAFVFGMVVGGAGLRFATYYLDKPEKKDSTNIVPTNTPAEVLPTPTVVPTRGDLKVKVLNGSGKSGAAATVKDELTELGYVVSDTGNADKADYEKTVVSVRTGKKVLGELLVNDLKKTYTVEDLKEVSDLESGIDALVIVGKK